MFLIPAEHISILMRKLATKSTIKVVQYKSLHPIDHTGSCMDGSAWLSAAGV